MKKFIIYKNIQLEDYSYSFGHGDFYPENKIIPRILQKMSSNYCDICGQYGRDKVYQVQCNTCQASLILCYNHAIKDFCPSCEMQNNCGESSVFSYIRPSKIELGEDVRRLTEEMFKTNLRQIAYEEANVSKDCNVCSINKIDIPEQTGQFFDSVKNRNEKKYKLVFCLRCGAPLLLCDEHYKNGECPACKMIDDMISKNTLQKTIEIYVPSGIEIDKSQFQNLFVPQVNDEEIEVIEELKKPIKQFRSGNPKHKDEINEEKSDQESIETKIETIQEESFNQHSKRMRDKIAKRYGL